MPNPQDEKLVRVAVAGGHLTDEQGAEALAALREIEGFGGSASAVEVLVKRGMLDQHQAEGLLAEAARASAASEPAASKPSGQLPRELGRFALLEKIGQGGMGSVFKARQTDLDRFVAVKVLKPRLARNAEFVERFLREARSAGRLNHPNIVAAIDVGESSGFYYFAMEYVDGETLADLLRREGPLPEDRAIAIAVEVARALDHAHSKDLVHRDIKPDNIMLTREGRVRVTDFGLAKTVDGGAGGVSDANRFLGTPAYMAPEQVRSDPNIDTRADVFSLGVTLFQMLTGERPFTGANTVAIAAAVIAEALPSIRKRRPDASIAVCRVVERMTAKEPDGRYATPADAVAALEAAAAAPRLKPRPAAGPARRARPRRRRTSTGVYLVVAAAALALLVILFLILSRGSGEPTRREDRSSDDGGGDHGVAAETVGPAETIGPERFVKSLQDKMAEAGGMRGDLPDAVLKKLEAYQEILDRAERERTRLAGEGRPSKELAAELAALAAEAGKQIGDLRTGEFTRRAGLADALFGRGSVGGAIAEVSESYPKALRDGTIDAQLDKRVRHYRDRALQKFKEAVVAKAEAFVQQKQHEKAKELYEGALEWGVGNVTKEAKARIAQIDAHTGARQPEASPEALRAYEGVAKTVVGLLKRRNYAQAATEVVRAQTDRRLGTGSLRPRLDDLAHLIRSAREVHDRARGYIENYTPGKKIRVCGIRAPFVRLHEGKIYLRSAPPLSFARVKTKEIVSFARSAFGATAKDREIKLALFRAAEGDAQSALRQLDAAERAGADVSRERALVERLAPLARPAKDGG